MMIECLDGKFLEGSTNEHKATYQQQRVNNPGRLDTYENLIQTKRVVVEYGDQKLIVMGGGYLISFEEMWQRLVNYKRENPHLNLGSSMNQSKTKGNLGAFQKSLLKFSVDGQFYQPRFSQRILKKMGRHLEVIEVIRRYQQQEDDGVRKRKEPPAAECRVLVPIPSAAKKARVAQVGEAGGIETGTVGTGTPATGGAKHAAKTTDRSSIRAADQEEPQDEMVVATSRGGNHAPPVRPLPLMVEEGDDPSVSSDDNEQGFMNDDNDKSNMSDAVDEDECPSLEYNVAPSEDCSDDPLELDENDRAESQDLVNICRAVSQRLRSQFSCARFILLALVVIPAASLLFLYVKDIRRVQQASMAGTRQRRESQFE